ncbi:asparagine synthase (glutamine-hydrolyzing) [Marinoscillum furvescens]|uniref:asparagine synthase (glutamine-hydrolyzing) n=1 Tax=Marinoscillum furvescens DSM 4134 TaxID=1122208 RepID=A0A3D9L6D2_MARFU|nr:asparagine synthase (glutamine-hydrolyzing) [Marinoscillum furvescens]RED99728.1 asparagine synthase (glutamine-hydrolysing) [Marinoscillum furvescens DSM 4134]
MCGITGIYAFNPVGRMHLVHLEEATKKLEKRGPDVHNTWFDEVVGLGHRRLSIIDTSSAGNQPMTDASNRYQIVFNGEIYNFLSLKKELTSLGHTFRSESDTEVLLYAYIQWGAKMLPRLNGFFALAIYDRDSRSLFVARDRYGIKPLLYYKDEDKLLFGSELKALLAFGVPKKLNLEALRTYFELTYIPAPLSILEGVQKLEAGHYLQVSDGAIQKQSYYKLPAGTSSPITHLDKAKLQLQDALEAAVNRRLVADVPLGAFLSGGIDSSIIVALASKHVQQLETFSIGFKDNSYFDETHFAELVAKKYGTNHHVFSLTNDDLLQGVDAAVDYLDEPFADSSALPVSILSQQTRQHVTVALSGDGADELFSGYNKHAAWIRMQSPGLQEHLASTLAPFWKVLPKSRNSPLSDTVRKLDRFVRGKNLSPQERYWFLASFTPQKQVDRLIRQKYKTNTDAFKSSIIDQIQSGSLAEVLALDVQMVLEGDMLRKVDSMSMANSLEVRVPFLDPEVVALAFSMDDSLKATSSARKIILREAFREILPKELYQRGKHGFEVPLLQWFRKELAKELDRLVFNDERLEAQGIFDIKEIARIRQQMYSVDPGDVHSLVWALYVFQRWYDRYFDH